VIDESELESLQNLDSSMISHRKIQRLRDIGHSQNIELSDPQPRDSGVFLISKIGCCNHHNNEIEYLVKKSRRFDAVCEFPTTMNRSQPRYKYSFNNHPLSVIA
jgi:hypothetical protein